MRQLSFVLLIQVILLSTTSIAFSARDYRMASSCPFSSQLSLSQQADNKNHDQKEVKCAPCEGMDPSSLLSVEQIQERLASSLPLWELIQQIPSSSSSSTATTEDEKKKDSLKIARKFKARNFQAALNAINAFGAIAEEQGHHPDLLLTNYRHVEVVLWTHSVGGITENDLILAQLFDQTVKIDYSPKWLKEEAHPVAKATAR